MGRTIWKHMLGMKAHAFGMHITWDSTAGNLIVILTQPLTSYYCARNTAQNNLHKLYGKL